MESKELIAKWVEELQLDGWEVDTNSISSDQVIIDDSIPKCDRYFIGVDYDIKTKKATIIHDRELTEEDILHELIHIKSPYYKEWEVVEATMYLLNRDKDNEER